LSLAELKNLKYKKLSIDLIEIIENFYDTLSFSGLLGERIMLHYAIQVSIALSINLHHKSIKNQAH